MRTITLHVWGDFACFTVPALRAERVSYPVMTPSGAKGILRSIYWKPEFEWRVRRIHVLKPIQTQNTTTKEVKSTGRVAQITDDTHTLVSNLILVDVGYIIEADIVVNPHFPGRDGAPPRTAASYMEEATKRMRRGQQFRQPFFGKTGYCALWELVEDDQRASFTPIPVTRDLGTMLFDQVPIDIDRDQFTPKFFHAQVVNGTLEVPVALYDEMLTQTFHARTKVHHVAA